MQMGWSTASTFAVEVVAGVLDPQSDAFARAVPADRGLVVADAGMPRPLRLALREYVELRLPGFAVVDLEPGEQRKSMATVLAIAEAAHAHGLGRRDALVAVGGGVCCDVVSVAAGLIRRGLPYVTVPSTLLAQVDAGIAVKGGVNLGTSKNYLGTFHPPVHVLVDPGLLTTLPRRELRSGLAEMLKMGIVRDADLVADLHDHGPGMIASGFAEQPEVGRLLVQRSIELMLAELARDPHEQGTLRRLVDFGHTVSPIIEVRSGYRIRHGEAVALDMALSGALAVELGLLGEEALTDLLTILSDLGLPAASPILTRQTVADGFAEAVRHRDGKLNLVVPTSLGAATFVPGADDVSDAAIGAALQRIAAHRPTRPRRGERAC